MPSLTLKDLHGDVLEALDLGIDRVGEFVAAKVGLERFEDETDSGLFERVVRWYLRTQSEEGPETLCVDLMYPRSQNPKRVEIELVDVRAADSLTVEFEFERDGWVLRMDRSRDRGSWMEVIEEKVEVAFVPAWNEVESDA